MTLLSDDYFEKLLPEIRESVDWILKTWVEFNIGTDWHRKLSDLYKTASICLRRISVINIDTKKEILEEIKKECNSHILSYRKYFIELNSTGYNQ